MNLRTAHRIKTTLFIVMIVMVLLIRISGSEVFLFLEFVALIAALAIAFLFVRCPHCGCYLSTHGKYCPKCGEELDW